MRLIKDRQELKPHQPVFVLMCWPATRALLPLWTILLLSTPLCALLSKLTWLLTSASWPAVGSAELKGGLGGGGGVGGGSMVDSGRWCSYERKWWQRVRKYCSSWGASSELVTCFFLLVPSGLMWIVQKQLNQNMLFDPVRVRFGNNKGKHLHMENWE